jgi:putative Mg2+ transporter-C (MgtC) family protein
VSALFPAMAVDWSIVVRHLVLVGVAYALAMPLGWEREARSQGAGLRTFPLVAAGSCTYLMIGQVVLEGSESHARLLYGLMTGIGFIGGGSILKERGSVHGTATAASIWNTGALGAAVAWGRFELALVLSLINFLTLRLVPRLKPLARDEGQES